ncbi:MAG: DUF1648 domain-containing protein [Nanoarchaeota archaeon]|nr:DUF1648 domain-containing protein [Nanoarchaeota archaeon]
MKKINLLLMSVISLSVMVSVLVYPNMPDSMVSHWSIGGVPNGFMPKIAGLFLMPVISVFITGLFLLIPKIDPKKKNIKKFRKQYDLFIFIIIFFMLYIHLLVILWNLGAVFSIIQFLSPAFAVLFYYIGILFSKAKQNWFIGIRTPWTLSSKRVWDKTHRKGSFLFKVVGVLSIFGVFFSDFALFFLLVPVLFSVVFLFIYSYFEFKRVG